MDMRSTVTEPQLELSPERERIRRDSGYTLTEMLVATVLMGTIILAIVGGMWAVVRASRQNDERAKTQAVLGAATDYLVAYLPVRCPQTMDPNPYLAQAQQAAAAVGWSGSTVSITGIKYWNPRLNDNEGDWQPVNDLDCNPAIGYTPNLTMQLVTVQVKSPSGQYVSKVDVVKADVRAEEVKDVSAP
jgi:prepilin-type N-terminal cleavage/methylation domain-containing protein